MSGLKERFSTVPFIAFLILLRATSASPAEEVSHGEAAPPLAASQPVLNVPDGFTIELVAGPPLVARPITGAFDDDGRLYVAESSGSNDPVEKQLAEKPHRIVRLEDVDGDGRFDKRVVFADRMMFPEGTMWLDGSLYVSAPPSIWRLTDTDGDGVADERVEWFHGKTLTGCANDLHGPYLGPDGWIYWCKGAFAEQTHDVRGRDWKSRAAHIWRSRPDGSGLEPVMTGGMDNPVDIAFTPDGERILSATYFVGNPRVDGLAHAVYGGLYGKEHGVLDGHVRTGPLMPLLAPMSPAAPCGLERYDSDAFGAEYRDNLFLCQFNLRKVSRHVLRPKGSTYESEDSDFVWSDHVDFHPTDVLVDADGSLLVVDTGGWYKLCCPTSQLWKPDVLGGIYRARRTGAVRAGDPRGRTIDWPKLTVEQLWDFLAAGQSAISQRASREFVRRRKQEEVRSFVVKLFDGEIVETVSQMPTGRESTLEQRRRAALARVWVLSQLESSGSRLLVRRLLKHLDEHVRHAALHSIALHRDEEATRGVVDAVVHDTPANRRVAAEALGRICRGWCVHSLLASADHADDRVLQHSITYALIELASPELKTLPTKSPGSQLVSLIARDQMAGGGVEASEVIPLLDSDDIRLRETAHWLVSRHAEWGDELTEWFRQRLVNMRDSADEVAEADSLQAMLIEFASQPSIQSLLGEVLANSTPSIASRRISLRVIAAANIAKPPADWRSKLADVAARSDVELLPLVVAAAQRLPANRDADDVLNRAMLAIVDSMGATLELRIGAFSAAVGCLREVSELQFKLLLKGMSPENPTATCSGAAAAIAAAPLNRDQLVQLCAAIKEAGPLELNRLLAPFSRSNDDAVGLKLIESLRAATALRSMRMDLLRAALAEYGPLVQQGIAELEASVNIDAAAQRRRIEELLPRMNEGDVRRGHAVFHSAKATCSACHRMGHAGGTTGPDLSRIGESRTERDLLESILYPSLSFVRSYEPMQVVTVDGHTINGTIVDETPHEYVLATGPNEQVRVKREDVDEMEPSTVSIMPGGLDGQLSVQELADLVAFLKNAAGK
jgi:putative membrane-bound dehydrogenase-like protein